MSDKDPFDDRVLEQDEEDDIQNISDAEDIEDSSQNSEDQAAWEGKEYVISSYLQEMQKYPLLEAEEEYMLATKWKEESDPQAAEKLVRSHLRLVAKIAAGYRGYGLNPEDLISEGLVGMMQALDKFDPEKGFRLSTYASWWIKAAIKEYILRSWSIVRLGTTAAQKRLFFNLRQLRNQIKQQDHAQDTRSMDEKLAERLGLPVKEVADMHKRMVGPDLSLNTPRDQEDEGEWLDWLEDPRKNQEYLLAQKDEIEKRKELLQYALGCLKPREYDIFIQRHLKEPPPTLEDLASIYGVSRERIRQIEVKAFTKVQTVMVRRAAELRLQVRP